MGQTKLPKKHRKDKKTTTVDSAVNKIGLHNTNAPQRPWNVTTATK